MFTKQRKSSARWLILSLMLGASACTSVGPVTDGGCSWVEPIRVSREDVLTDGTVEQILNHNEKLEVICGGAR